MNKTNLKGYTVFYEDNAPKGIEHLGYVLDFQESEELFRQARQYGKTVFEDRLGRNFTLTRNPDGSFTVSVR